MHKYRHIYASYIYTYIHIIEEGDMTVKDRIRRGLHDGLLCVCMYIYVYMYICIYVYIHTYIHTYRGEAEEGDMTVKDRIRRGLHGFHPSASERDLPEVSMYVCVHVYTCVYIDFTHLQVREIYPR